MEKFYTSERNTQMLIYLMKAHGIRKVIISPGATNVCFVASVQQDSFFELYSSVDERSAAYIACGLAAESGEPVALNCTGATASRNYLPGLTEGYYRKLPILAVTAAQHIGRIGQNIPQAIDRTTPLNDIVRMSVQIPTIHNTEDEWAYGVMLNKALLELRRHGGGPVHINLETSYSSDFTVKELPPVPVIHRVCYWEQLPELKSGRVGIFVGAHKRWNAELTQSVDAFCEAYDGVVICDHTSNYHGKYRILAPLAAMQKMYRASCVSMDVMIHIGDISGAYMEVNPKQVWRVNPDGEVRDTFRGLRYVFEMEETDFFRFYASQADGKKCSTSFYSEWKMELEKLRSKIPELPFSNIWAAEQTASLLPKGSVLHLGILNSLRAWNFFEIPESILAYSNTGGFGIDGGVSSLAGAALAAPDKLFFGVVGDLAFFYDMNVLGNRYFGKNIRLMLVNNGRGTEFRNYNHPAARFGDDADPYMAAAGHFGQQSPCLVKHFAEDLGYEYLCASNKKEYLAALERFLSQEPMEKPMLFEVFTDYKDESDALKIMYTLETSVQGAVKQKAKDILGEHGVMMLKKVKGKLKN